MRRWLLNQFRTFRKLYLRWRDQLTTMGKLVFLVMVCSLPTLTDSGAVWGIVFIATSALLLVTSAASYLYRPQLDVQVSATRQWRRSECRAVRVEVTNVSRRPLYDLQLELLPQKETWEIVEGESFQRVLQPGETVTMPATLRALRRGLCRLPRLRATTLFPFQLIRREEVFDLPRQALILPFYHSLRSFELLGAVPTFTRGDTSALHTLGLQGDYVGSREYQPGVPVRKWDYSSWARLGQPVVREYSTPSHPSAAVLLDTFFPAGSGRDHQPIRELEAMLSLAAAITEALITRGSRIELLVLGDQLWTGSESLASADHQTILELLALVQPGQVDKLDEVTEQVLRLPLSWDLAVVLSHRATSSSRQLFESVTRRQTLGTHLCVDASDPRVVQSRAAAAPRRITCADIEAGWVEL